LLEIIQAIYKLKKLIKTNETFLSRQQGQRSLLVPDHLREKPSKFQMFVSPPEQTKQSNKKI
jgi:hypothetical protein